MGRFLSGDPYQASGGPANPQSWNRYNYALNDPVNLSDPSGLIVNVPPGCIYSQSLGLICAGGGRDPDPDPSGATYCAIHPEDPACGGPTEGNAYLYSHTPIKNKSGAKGLVGDAFAEIGDCGKALRGLFGDNVFQKMGDAVNNGEVAFYDARADVDGGTSASDLYSGASSKTLAELTAHDNAMVLQDSAGNTSNIVVFGQTFWGKDFNAKLQQRTVVHELLHAVMKVNDKDLGGSVDFQKWLNNDCQGQFPGQK